MAINRKTYGRAKAGGQGGTFRRNEEGNWNKTSERRQDYAKKSGCKQGTAKTGRPYVTGWNVSQQNGYMTFIAFPSDKMKETVSENGVIWQSWIMKVRKGMETRLIPCLYEVGTGRVLVREINMIANPKAPNGGYWGRMISKR